MCLGVRISGLQSSGSNQGTLKSFLKPEVVAAGPGDETESQIDESAEVQLEEDCPICGCQVSADNLILNQHIDECLNKSAIQEAIQDCATLPLSRGESRKRNQRGNTTNMDKKKSKLWNFKS